MPSFRERVTHVPAWAWVAAIGVAALVVLTVNHWALAKPEGAKWLDPEQPPLQIDAKVVEVPQRTRPYPGSLSEWSDCIVGDC
jgi:hypothetical protein